ncbi:MAG TPA: hypothetical protein HPP87_04845 [Planctomycetes bacterium]|nr:hypothetical protein [Planctomycetota bacterium]
MSIIYEPRGRAAEYAHLAINHYKGCTHGCLYCYCPKIMRDPAFHRHLEAKENVIKAVRKEAAFIAGTNRRVLLSFAGDPYNGLEPDFRLTEQILKILRAMDIPFQILTKGGLLAAADFGLYGPKDAFAATMTLLDAGLSKRIEPGAALPAERTAALKEAYIRDIKTWVSLEPVLDGEQALEIIRQTAPIVAHYKIGALNHAELLPEGCDIPAKNYSAADWRRFGAEAARLCERYGRTYWVKQSLAKFMDGISFYNTDTRTVDG